MKTSTRLWPRWLGRALTLAALALAAAASAQPTITAQPTNTNALVGGVATFTVAATGSGSLGYRWQRGGTNIFNGDFGGRVSGATNPTVVISNLNATDTGSYRVIVSNVSGTVTSAPAALTVLFPPSFTAQPVSLTVTQGNNFSLTAAATGTAPLVYQWRKFGVNLTDSAHIGGATSNVLSVFSATTNDANVYRLIISNNYGAITSAAATVTVLVPPSVTLAPTNQTAIAGLSATLTAAAAGDAPLTYQWLFNGAPISSATNASLALAVVTTNHAGNYQFVAANNVGSVTSSVVVLTVIVPPQFITPSTNVVAFAGDTVTLSDTAIGTAPLAYHWTFNGTDIPGATSNVLVVIGTNTVGGFYDLVVTNAAGSATNSNHIQFANRPTVFIYPPSQTVNVGSSAYITASIGGTFPITFQWRLNGSPVVGATNSLFAIASTTTNDTGNYTCVVYDYYGPAGSVTSTVSVLTVLLPPFVVASPVALTNVVGQSAAFTVAAGGSAPLAFQWLSNGVALADTARVTGSATSNLVFTSTLVGDAANYSCVITNAAGSVTSVVAALTVLVPPSVTVAPASQTILSGNSATFTATPSGTPPFTFQWLKNNSPLANATNNPLAFANATTNDTADYQVIVANAASSITSSVVTLAVFDAPFIVTPPLAQTVVENQFVSFAVTAGGTAPLAYQWLSNGVPLADTAGISGSATSQLSFSSVPRGFAANYSCVVTNAYGSVTSAPAALAVNFAPYFETSPASSTNDPGSTLTLSSTVRGTLPIDFQWQFYGQPFGVPGRLTNDLAATAKLTLSNLTTDQNGPYTLVVSNVVGVVTSAVANVTVQYTLPAFTLQPANRTLAVSNQLQFVTLATGSSPLAYQWFANGVALTNDDRTLGADTATLTLTNALLTDSGNYFVVASNPAGAVTSAVAVVSVLTPPSISTVTSNQTGIVTSNLIFSVVADGSAPLAFQWFRNGVTLANGGRYSGVTTDTLALSNLAVADAGSFSCRVTNAVGSVSQVVVVLTVITPPGFTNQPVSRSAVLGQTVSFTATATNNLPIGYQWQFTPTAGVGAGVSINIPGATNTTLNVFVATTNDFGSYHLVASNAAGATVSAEAALTRGQIVAWGSGLSGFTIATNLLIPASLTNIIAVACGDNGSTANSTSSHNLALRDDGTVFAWGSNNSGETNVPANATNVVAIAAGRQHSVALRADGTVVAWGLANFAAQNFPTGLSNVVAIAAGGFQCLALRADGKVFIWGDNSANNQNSVPLNFARMVSLGAGYAHSLAVRADGQVFAWGNTNGLNKTGGGPAVWQSGLTDFSSVAGGLYHSVGIRSNGTVTVWPSGSNLVSAIPPSATNITQVAAGDYFNLALRADGNVIAWGTNTLGVTNVPTYATNVLALAAGQSHALALLGDGRPLITRPPIGGTSWTGRSYTFAASVTGDASLALQWQMNGTNIPNATNATLTLPNLTTNDAGGYRLVASNALGVATSVAAPLTVNVTIRPAFYALLGANWTNYVGGKLWLNGAATGSGPLTWQWKFNGTNINGATNEDLVFDPLQVTNDGSYNVIVSNTVTHNFEINSSSVVAGNVGSTQRVALVRTWGYLATDPPLTGTNAITNAVAIAAGFGSSAQYGYYWSLRSDGKLAGWGPTTYNEAAPYSNYASSTITALAMGYGHTVALRSDGTVVDWGNGQGGTGYNPNVVPANVTGAVAVGAGDNSAIAVRGDGSVVAWGNASGSPIAYITNVPASASNVVSVVGGPQHCLALRTDGRVVGWGSSSYFDITNVPATITNIVALAPGAGMSTYIVGLAVRADGTVAIWGNSAARYSIPVDWTNIVSLVASSQHITALRSDGTVATIGTYFNQSSAAVPAYTENVIAIAAGGDHDVALFGPRVPAIAVQPWNRAIYRGSNTTFHARSVSPVPASFQWLFNGAPIVGATNWSFTLPNAQFTNNGAYQLVVSNRYGVTTSKAAKLTVTLPLADALDTTNENGASLYNWTTTGGAQWFGQAATTHDGVDAAQAGSIGNSSETILQTIVTNSGPTAGTVSFWWKISSEAGFDTLEFRNNGNLLATISGEVGWEQRTFTASPGTNVLQWRYSKDSSNSGGADTAWVDQSAFTSGPPVITFITPPRTVTVPSNFNFSVTVAGVSPLSYRWFKDGTNLVGFSSTLGFNPVTRTNAGSYTCVVSNAGGFVSNNTALTVIAPQLLAAPTLQPDGSLQFSSTDADGGLLTAADLARMELQASDTFTNWITLTNALSLTNGVLQFRDPQQTNFPARYYRIVEH